MDNPTRVLTTLDRHLNHEVSLVIYGRAALCLGFDQPREEFANTEDVDGTIRLSQSDALSNDAGFWDAIEATNEELETDGLYLTHLFRADQVFLRADWERHIQPIARPTTKHLNLLRPATIDLILTKMMRGADDLDMEDITFLVHSEPVTLAAIERAFEQVRLPDVPELQQAFEKAKPLVRQIVSRFSGIED